MLKVDFLRMSNNGRITLVLDASAQWVRSLWTVMTLEDLREARIALARREGTYSDDNPTHHIDAWSTNSPSPPLIEGLPEWCKHHGIEHVIWTALRSRFHRIDRTPSADEVVDYLRGLQGDKKIDAERYIRRAPKQVMTPLRHRIGVDLGWTPE
jgi:hypothetical protein